MGRPLGKKDTRPRKIRDNWRPYELNILRKKYAATPNKDLCKMLNKSLSSIKAKARQIGLIKHVVINDENLDKIINVPGICGLWNEKHDMYYVMVSKNAGKALKEKIEELDSSRGAKYHNRLLQEHWWEDSELYSGEVSDLRYGGVNFHACRFECSGYLSWENYQRLFRRTLNILTGRTYNEFD